LRRYSDLVEKEFVVECCDDDRVLGWSSGMVSNSKGIVVELLDLRFEVWRYGGMEVWREWKNFCRVCGML
jgi:hypothetical protein